LLQLPGLSPELLTWPQDVSLQNAVAELRYAVCVRAMVLRNISPARAAAPQCARAAGAATAVAAAVAV
jgi:hypothetical protein